MSEDHVRFDANQARKNCDEVGNAMANCDAARLAKDLDLAARALFDNLAVERRLRTYPSTVELIMRLTQAAELLLEALDERLDRGDLVKPVARGLLHYHISQDLESLAVAKDDHLARYKHAVDGLWWVTRWLRITDNTIKADN